MIDASCQAPAATLTQAGIRTALRATAPDRARRRTMVGQALRMVAGDLPCVTLDRRRLDWAMAREVDVVQWPNDTIERRRAKRR